MTEDLETIEKMPRWATEQYAAAMREELKSLRARVQRDRQTLIQAKELLDIFIEGGYAEAEDLPLLDSLHRRFKQARL